MWCLKKSSLTLKSLIFPAGLHVIWDEITVTPPPPTLPPPPPHTHTNVVSQKEQPNSDKPHTSNRDSMSLQMRLQLPAPSPLPKQCEVTKRAVYLGQAWLLHQQWLSVVGDQIKVTPPLHSPPSYKKKQSTSDKPDFSSSGSMLLEMRSRLLQPPQKMWSLEKSTHTHTPPPPLPQTMWSYKKKKTNLPQTSLIFPAAAQCCWRWDPHTGQWPWHTAVGWWHSLCVTTAVNHGSDLESTNHCDKKSKLAQLPHLQRPLEWFLPYYCS